MPHNEIVAQIAAFLAKAFEGAEIAPDQDIFASGFGNSMFAMQMVNFVETTFGIELDGGDLDIDNFRSISRVADLVVGKQGGSRS